MIKKNFIIFIIITVLLIGGYFLFKGDEQNIVGEDYTTYKNSTYGFSINLPTEMQVSSFTEGEGETVLITNDLPAQAGKLPMTNGERNFQMQIYVSFFDEDIVLTAERIKQDLPDMVVENTQSVKVGEVPAVSFVSTNDQGQKTKEIWLVYKNNLYQFFSLLDNEKKMEGVISEWSWD